MNPLLLFVLGGGVLYYFSKVGSLKELVVKLAGLQVHKVSSAGIDLAMKLSIFNPTSRNATIKQISGTIVNPEGRALASFRTDPNLNLPVPKGQTGNLSMLVNINFLDALSIAKEIGSNANAYIATLTAAVTLGTDSGSFRVIIPLSGSPAKPVPESIKVLPSGAEEA